MATLLIINGPNLNLLGTREPELYGTVTLKEIEAACADLATSRGFSIDFRQSNHEGQLIDWIQEARAAQSSIRGIVINPAALTHTSLALQDALKAVPVPCVEVHLSNVFQREDIRHRSFISPVAIGVISGFGADGYLYAIDSLIKKVR